MRRGLATLLVLICATVVRAQEDDPARRCLGLVCALRSLVAGSSQQFQVDVNGNVVRLNGVTTSFPSANATGVLRNNGTGTYQIISDGTNGGGLPSGVINRVLRNAGAGVWSGASDLLSDGAGNITLGLNGGSVTVRTGASVSIDGGDFTWDGSSGGVLQIAATLGTLANSTTLRRINDNDSFDPTGTSVIVRLIDLSPSISAAGGTLTNYGFTYGATFTNTVAPFLYSNSPFRNDATYQSATNAVPPFMPDSFDDHSITQMTANSATDSTFSVVSFLNHSTVSANAGNYTLGDIGSGKPNLTAVWSDPILNATSGKTMSVARRTGTYTRDIIKTGAGTNTLTNNYGHFVDALTGGTNNFQYGAAGMARSSVGTVEAGDGAMFMESTTPVRLAVKNPTGDTYVPGATQIMTGWTNGTISTSAATFFAIDSSTTTTSATETSVVPRFNAPGALHLVGMCCAINTAPGASKSYAFVPMSNGSAVTNTTCTISGATAKSCCIWPGTTDAVADANPLTMRTTPAGTPTAWTLGICKTYYTSDNVP